MEDVFGAPSPLRNAQSASAFTSRSASRSASRFSWLALALALPLTSSRCRRLRESFPDAVGLGRLLETALGGDTTASRHALQQIGPPGGPLDAAQIRALVSTATRERVDEARQWLDARPDCHLVPIDAAAYPARLRDTLDPPPLLFVRGSLGALQGPGIAIVGSRDVSPAGRDTARRSAHELAAAGLSIISGLALGTDAEAHAGALEAGGTTVAFMGTGIDEVYPRRHARLAAGIVAGGGALISEFPLRHPPQPWAFPLRNRLISGMSEGVLVVEAALPSGTLTTARHALDQGREVMAVPGPIHHAGSAGCHALLREGATLVTCTDDVLLQLARPLQSALDDATPGIRPDIRLDTKPAIRPEVTPRLAASALCRPPDDPDERTLWEVLASGQQSVDGLVRSTGLDAGRITGALARLELDERVAEDSSGRYSRRSPAI